MVYALFYFQTVWNEPLPTAKIYPKHPLPDLPLKHSFLDHMLLNLNFRTLYTHHMRSGSQKWGNWERSLPTSVLASPSSRMTKQFSWLKWPAYGPRTFPRTRLLLPMYLICFTYQLVPIFQNLLAYGIFLLIKFI